MIARLRITTCVWLALGVLGLALRAGAADFGFSASATPNPVTVSNTLTYSFNITNTSGGLLTNVFLTNQLSYIPTGTNPPGWLTLGSNTLVFQITNLFPEVFTNLTRFGSPLVSGIRTNSLFWTNTATLVVPGLTNITTNLVTKVLIPQCDLQVALAAPPGVVVNDLIVLELSVTNLGPDTAPNVLVTNILPPSFKFLGLTPAGLTSTLTNHPLGMSLVINIGALTNKGSAQLHLQVQPTNSGPFALGANIVASPVLDTNLVNNVASITNFNVSPTLPGELQVSLVSTQRFNPQTGLMEQTIRLSNTGLAEVVSARVLVAGLTNWLFNASGTNGSAPFVVYGGPLAIGESVTMLLKFFVPTRQAVTNFTLLAVEVPLPIPLVPAGTPVPITRILQFGLGQTLIEFPSTTNRSYTLVYSDNVSFSNARPSQPALVAPADQTQWIDDGPPATSTALTNVPARFYRVILNQ